MAETRSDLVTVFYNRFWPACNLLSVASVDSPAGLKSAVDETLRKLGYTKAQIDDFDQITDAQSEAAQELMRYYGARRLLDAASSQQDNDATHYNHKASQIFYQLKTIADNAKASAEALGYSFSAAEAPAWELVSLVTGWTEPTS